MSVCEPTILAVVADGQLQGIGQVRHPHLEPRCTRVLEGVGDRLLHDPVGGEIERCRQRPLGSGGLQGHLKPRIVRGFEQRIDLLQSGLRAQLWLPGLLPEHAEQAVELRERLPGADLDRLQRLLGFPVHVPGYARRAGLDGHEADVVRDHVVQLARDAQPLVLHRLPARCLRLAAVARDQLHQECAPAADVVTDHPRHQHRRAEREQRLAPRGDARNRRDEHDQCLEAEERDHPQPRRRAAVNRHRVSGQDDGAVRRDLREAEQLAGQQGGGDDDQHGHRLGSSPPQRHRLEKHEHQGGDEKRGGNMEEVDGDGADQGRHQGDRHEQAVDEPRPARDPRPRPAPKTG
jgi:hypothetical protein